MITIKTTAKKVEKTMRNCSMALDQSVRLVMDTCSAHEFKAYRKVIGQIMGVICLDVMHPIYSRFPDLTPEGLKKRKRRSKNGDTQTS